MQRDGKFLRNKKRYLFAAQWLWPLGQGYVLSVQGAQRININMVLPVAGAMTEEPTFSA
jgi:hypothetical protein